MSRESRRPCTDPASVQRQACLWDGGLLGSEPSSFTAGVVCRPLRAVFSWLVAHQSLLRTASSLDSTKRPNVPLAAHHRPSTRFTSSAGSSRVPQVWAVEISGSWTRSATKGSNGEARLGTETLLLPRIHCGLRARAIPAKGIASPNTTSAFGNNGTLSCCGLIPIDIIDRQSHPSEH